ncbi:MAG: hypothetical protein EU549_02930 [Promethearchaeota archaeon]|nr:MAG: hypothetical protein EU549_02930 [Candidatus Lokiarchaeota archaeon]
MIDFDKINCIIVLSSFLLIFSIFLPWLKYIDVAHNYNIDLNALNLLTGTFGMGFIQWSNFLDTYGFVGYHIPLIIPMISGIIGVVLGMIRIYEKYRFIEENKHNEVLLWISTLSFGAILYTLVITILFSNILWNFDVLIYLNGSGIIICFIGTVLLFISGIILKKQTI